MKSWTFLYANPESVTDTAADMFWAWNEHANLMPFYSGA